MFPFRSNSMKSWAQEWNFFHSPQKPLQYPNEWIAGVRDQRLVKVAWGGEKGRRLFVIIRFAGCAVSGSVRESLRTDESLRALPGWKKIKPAAESSRKPAGVGHPEEPGTDYERPGFKLNDFVHHDLVADDRSIIWSHTFSFRRPQPAKLRGWVEALLQSLSRTTQGFDGRCEMCDLGRTSGYVLFEGVPMMICPGCRERVAHEGEMAERHYEQEDANVVLGSLLAVVGAAVGGAAYAGFAILTGRLLAVLALGIALLVGWAYKLGARKLDRVGQVVGGALTLAGALFGIVLLYAWEFAQARPDVGFRLDAGWWLFVRMLETKPADIIFTAVFGIVGGFVAASVLRKPRFTPKIESPEESEQLKKAA